MRKREFIECPACGWKHMEPLEQTPSSVSWGDCACSDTSTCIVHQVSHEISKRPTQNELVYRAMALTEKRRTEFDRLVRRLKNIREILLVEDIT
jgi:hypothetical protein